jgi:peptidoglycan/LPS O-acetylase OafA/YrhL
VLGGLVVTRVRWIGWLNARPMVLLGRLSYGLYLFHNFGINFAEAVIPHSSTSLPWSLLSTTLGFGASVLGVWVLHILVEKPCIRLGHRVSARIRKDQKQVPETAAAFEPADTQTLPVAR